MRCADLAMFRAKLAGERFAIYQEDLDGAANRMQLVDELRAAIEHRELVLHYQPQVDLSTGDIPSVEALVRWIHPRLRVRPAARVHRARRGRRADGRADRVRAR